MSCPHCQESARFVGYRPKDIKSLVGAVELSRPYYHCRHCHQGTWPWDEILRLSPERLTPGAQEVAALHGILNSFSKAANQVMAKSAGLSLSESTVERTTEGAGQRLGTWLKEGEMFGPRASEVPEAAFKWNRDAEGKTCAYVGVDATGIMMQGPNGAKADGRMVDVGMIFNPQARAADEEDICKPCEGVRYLAGQYTLEELGPQMRRQGAQVGMDAAERWIALTDAGQGLEHFIDVNFPRAEKIVDFRHASEYVNDFAKAYRVGGAGEALATTWCHKLKHEGGAALLAELAALDRTTMNASAQEEYDSALSYFGNHSGRMDYPTYLRKGWQIGTGAVESACKTVVNQRLNMGGMRWGEEGSDAVCHLRALFCSDMDQWDAFWSHTPRAAKVNNQMAA
jgi:hypothetical protein